MIFKIKKEKTSIQETASASFANRLQHGLLRTRSLLMTDIQDLISGKQTIDQVTLEQIEERLLMADLGIKATTFVTDAIAACKIESSNNPSEQILSVLHETLLSILQPVTQPLVLPLHYKKPFVILVTGVNGVGKTTGIGKLAFYFMQMGYKIMLAAGDTYRAAAVEQLQTWGERNKVPVIAQHDKADSAAVIFDALQSARARDIDILIADTAGRLHTQGNLMEELKKVRRVTEKFDSELDVECLLVLDAGTGQNAITQAREFDQAIGITGIMLTKLDGTARGGIIFAIAKELGIPVRFIGVGEQLEDLQVFNSNDFVNALLDSNA